MTHLETRAVHVEVPDVVGSRPANVPIYQTSAFAFAEPDLLADAISRPDGAYVYGRSYANPTVRALEATVADLEGGAAALAAASGMGAISTVLFALLQSGDHVIAQNALYGGTYALLRDLEKRYGISVTYVAEDDPDEVRRAVRPESKLLYLETIANPITQVANLPAMFAAGKDAGLLGVVDNTFATPVICRPIEHGADVVIHSTTKYLSGHGDVVGGISVFAADKVFRKVWSHAIKLGASADPFSAWLTIRGIKTLALRVRRQSETALDLAGRLAAHPAVEAVYYPGLAGHPSHALANTLLGGMGGGVLAFDIRGGREAGAQFMRGLRLALVAPSLGDVTTRVLHPASTSHKALDSEELKAMGFGEGTVRVAVGIEYPDDIWADLAAALPL